MPTAKRREPVPAVGDDVRVYVDASMIDEPARIVRVEEDHVIVHVWPDSDERTKLGAYWFPTEEQATAHGYLGAWPE